MAIDLTKGFLFAQDKMRTLHNCIKIFILLSNVSTFRACSFTRTLGILVWGILKFLDKVKFLNPPKDKSESLNAN